jgi:hypothetical protein
MAARPAMVATLSAATLSTPRREQSEEKRMRHPGGSD